MLLTISEWAQATWWATFVRESTMGFAIASVFLLFGIAVLLSGVVFMCLRLFGWAMANRPIPEVARDFRVWTVAGLLLTLVAGPSMWAAEAMRFYDSPSFWLEQQLLAAAILFQFTWFEWVVRQDDAPAALRGVTGAVALALWFGVGVAGRMIGFF